MWQYRYRDLSISQHSVYCTECVVFTRFDFTSLRITKSINKVRNHHYMHTLEIAKYFSGPSQSTYKHINQNHIKWATIAVRIISKRGQREASFRNRFDVYKIWDWNGAPYVVRGADDICIYLMWTRKLTSLCRLGLEFDPQ